MVTTPKCQSAILAGRQKPTRVGFVTWGWVEEFIPYVLVSVAIGAGAVRAAPGEPAKSQSPAGVSVPSSGSATQTSSVPSDLKDCLGQLEAERLRTQDLESRVSRLQARLREVLQWKTVRELEEQVSEIRGLPVKKHVQVQTLDRAQTVDLVNRLIDRELPPDKVLPIERTLVLLGALPSGTNQRSALVELFSEQIGGLYDDRAGKLYVTDMFDPEGSVGRMILAHEICHALQDQNFDFSRMNIHETDNDDRTYAIAAVMEGDAMVLMINYMRKQSVLGMLLDLPKALSMDQASFNSAPPYLQYLLIFPYLEGMSLMMIADAESSDGGNALLRSLPRSTEQVIHPEKYFGPEVDEPVQVTAPDLSAVLGQGWVLRAENTYGEAGIRAILMHGRPLRLSLLSLKPISVGAETEQAAEGWGGDRVGIWIKEEAAPRPVSVGHSERPTDVATAATTSAPGSELGAPAVVGWRTLWDTQRDAEEFREYAVSTWIPSIMPGARETSAATGGSRSWQGSDSSWVRVDWQGKRVDVFIGRGGDSLRVMNAAIPAGGM